MTPPPGRLTFMALPFRWVRLLRRRRSSTMLARLSEPLDELLQLLFHEVSAGMAVVDRSGHIVRVNDTLRAMARNEIDSAPGRPIIGVLCPQRRDEAWAELTPVLNGRRAPRPFVSVVPGPAGDHTVDIAITALREADGSVSGLVLRLSDITVQRQLETQLAQSQKLQALGQLAGGIAHDFNNLLTAILVAADEQLGRSTLDAAAQEDMVQIRRSAQRGAALVRQLLAFGRQQTLQPQILSLNDVIQDVSTLLIRLLGSRITLDLNLEQPGAHVRVDPTQLEQVLINLAVNARDAMQEGGTLTLHSGHITLFRPLVRGEETIPPGRYAMFEVRDTGAGIPADILPRIFDPFFTTRRELGGTGLGLSTVHGIVRQSDGFLAVDSRTGEGTSMRVYLPRADPDAPLTIPVPPPVEVAGPGVLRRVLLVDDEEPVRKLAERALTQRGWTVMSAGSGEEALAMMAEGGEADIVVSDVVMPGMDGPALVRALRERRPGLPAILASGYAEETLRRDILRHDTLFIAKPYSLKQLAAMMDATVAAVHPPA